MHLYIKFRGINLRYDVESFPGPLEFFLQVMFCMIIEDGYSFWCHYILHIPYFYKKIHRKHHEYKAPFTLIAEYANFIEYIIGNMFPS